MLRNMNLKHLALAAAATFAGVASSSVLAEDNFSVTGPIAYGYVYDSATGTYQYLTGGTYEATISHDSTTPLSYTEYYNSTYYYYGYEHWYSYWEHAVTEIVYKVFDSSGNQVAEFSHQVDLADYDYGGTTKGLVAYNNYADFRYEQWNVNSSSYDENHYQYDYSYVYTQDYGDIAPEEIAGIETYPNIFDNEAWDYSEFYASRSGYDYTTNTSDEFYFSGVISEVGAGDLDTDGDGILDSEDACTESDLSTTVLVGDKDTGVDNLLLESGCTVSDTILQIQADEERHGQVVNGVSHFLNYLKDAGIISGKEKGKIQSTVAKSNDKANGKKK